MIEPVPSHDTLSLSMFWAGALMVFTPLIGAAAVLAVWWRQRVKERDGREPSQHPPGP